MENFNSNPNLQFPEATPSFLTFTDFPEDVQLCILSFLSPSEISSFSCTSKRFASLCRSDTNLWFSMCERRWGSKTHIKKWAKKGQIRYRFLYKTLDKWENLIGFWRCTDQRGNSTASAASPPLVFFEWGPSFITGSRVSPSKNGTYGVSKIPFIWIGVSQHGELISLVDSESRFKCSRDFVRAAELGFLESELVPVSVSFMGNNHFIVEENLYYGIRTSSSYGEIFGVDLVEDITGVESSLSSSPGSSPDESTSEMYIYFANRTSPSGERGSRRQRKKEKERLGRRKLEAEYFLKINNCSPTPLHPLQGLWKGICEDMSLHFYVVAYDDIGGITCRRIGDSSEPFPSYSPVFWTSNTTFVESPFSSEEDDLYDGRIHLRPIAANCTHGYSPIENEVVSRLLYINSSYELVIPNFTGSSVDPRHVEGRIWQYKNGTFGFGFLRNNFVVDLKHIALNGFLLDNMESWEN